MKYETSDGIKLDSIDKRIPLRIYGPDIDVPIDIFLDFDDVSHGLVAYAIEELSFILSSKGWDISNR
jgi:hypothetical protein